MAKHYYGKDRYGMDLKTQLAHSKATIQLDKREQHWYNFEKSNQAHQIDHAGRQAIPASRWNSKARSSADS